MITAGDNQYLQCPMVGKSVLRRDYCMCGLVRAAHALTMQEKARRETAT
jgi:hypothetical protein